MDQIKITLPDKKVLTVQKGATVYDAVSLIGPRLAQAAICAKVNSKLVDLSYQIHSDCDLVVCTYDSPEGKSVLNHSCAHILAQAVTSIWPEVGLGVGPAIDEGFYYDFSKSEPFMQSDLTKIEEEMKKIVQANYSVQRKEVNKKEAKDILSVNLKKNKYRLMILDELPEEIVSFYQQGPFIDLCRGPHAPSTGVVKAFKLLKVSSAYWKADAKNDSLQRIYGIAFPSQKLLDEHLKLLEEASERDHRKIAKELDLFSIDDSVGAGLILYHPNGAIIRSEMEKFMAQENLKRGYVPVLLPHIMKSDLWRKSGHYSNYKENMYFTQIDEIEYGLKPMNCPGHIVIYNSGSHSYKELPLRYYEFATVYRHELSGVLSGLFRVRGFTQDDSHMFMTESQLGNEVSDLLQFAIFVLKTFGFKEFVITLSTKPEKAIGSDEIWQKSTESLREALVKLGIKYEIDEGGGAFYGPKIDIKIKDAIGRLWQCSTIQVDWNQPERFDVNYVGSDGNKHRCVIVHRAIFGSFERFLGILIEHYNGSFPLWLSPKQVSLLPVADRHIDYCKSVYAKLKEEGIRVHIDESADKIGAKIRNSQLQKVNYMLVIGDKESETNLLSIRNRNGQIQNEVSLDSFISQLRDEIKTRKLD